MRVGLLVFGGLLTIAIVLHRLGVSGVEWGTLEAGLEESGNAVRTEVIGWGQTLTRVLPSAAAAGAGVVVGLRR